METVTGGQQARLSNMCTPEQIPLALDISISMQRAGQSADI